MKQPCPPGLGSGGSELWTGVAAGGDLDPVQLVNLLEACRQKDRLDKLDEMLRGELTLWARLIHRTATEDYELVIDRGFASALAAANQMKQHLAALRLPDSWGDRPQKRGAARGAYVASGVESSERAAGASRKRLKVVGSAG